MTKANCQIAADAFEGWRDDLFSGTPPTLWPIGQGALARLELGPGRVWLLGGAPGAGKTAFVLQCIVDALRLTPTLRALVANVEMPPGVLLDRQLARLSGIDLGTIRHRRFEPHHADRLDQGLHTLDAVAERLAFVRFPFDLENVAASADGFHADVIVLDYIQRFAAPGSHGDKRGSVDATMSYLRQFADAGVAVLVVAAVSRGKDSKGRTSYSADALNLASFRESSELEFGADDAFILTPDDDDLVILKHLKSRNGEARDLTLRFDRPHQSFTPTDAAPSKAKRPSRENGKLQAALRNAWARTPPADDTADDDQGPQPLAEFEEFA